MESTAILQRERSEEMAMPSVDFRHAQAQQWHGGVSGKVGRIFGIENRDMPFVVSFFEGLRKGWVKIGICFWFKKSYVPGSKLQ